MAENEPLQKAENLWFSTDIVILRAGTRVFRVFAAILKAQSSVFADMFTFPQPPSADMETMDGFPVVELHDQPEEVEVFLKAIFDSSFFMPPPAEFPVLNTLGILRLSHKYDVPYLRRRALEHLARICPTRLSEYDTRGDNTKLEVNFYVERFITLSIASEVGALWLLPVVYHDLCKQRADFVMSGAWWNAVGEKELIACRVGYAAQMRHLPKILSFLSVPKDAEAECDDWPECNRVRLEYTHDEDIWATDMSWPLEAWAAYRWSELESAGLCEYCITEAKALHAAARQEFWDQLPQMFGLPEWEELEELKRVAFST